MAWFAVPFGFATTLGLAAVALTDNPAYPTCPNNMISSQISSGLSGPFVAVALLGKSGSIALLLTLFMAVISSSSSELIAVSSILTFDIYKKYMKPLATPEELIKIAHIMIYVFSSMLTAFAYIWNTIGIDLGWLFLVKGLLIGGAVFPAALIIKWKKQSKYGAVAGAFGGLTAGRVVWLVTAQTYYGELTVATTGDSYPTLAGDMVSVLTGLLLHWGVVRFCQFGRQWGSFGICGRR
jgi:urea-proton symporter